MVASPLYLVTLVATALSVAAAPHHKRTPTAAAASDLDLAGLEPRVALVNGSSAAAPAPVEDLTALLPSATATATSPSVALVTSLALSSELRALVKRNAPYEHFAALLARQLPAAASSEIDVHSLYLSLVRSRALSHESPTPWTPGQSARYSALARSRASATSSMRKAGTCKITSDCVTTAPANANTYCDDGKCSYRCRSGFSDTGSSCVSTSTSTTTTTKKSASTTKKATTTTKKATTTTKKATKTTTTKAPAATTCAVSSDCSNSVPDNSNRYCDGGKCSYRCRLGFEASGSSCVATSTTTTTTTSAPPATKTCAVSADCLNDVPDNSNRYCDEGECSYRCRSGFEASGSACVATSTTATTTTTTAPPAVKTCAVTSDCSNEVPDNANRFCQDGECSYRCRSGFEASGSSCVATSTTTTTTTSAPPATKTCAVSADCSNEVPDNSNRYCDAGECSYRCRSGFEASGSSCIASSITATTATTTTTSAPSTQTCSISSDCTTNSIPANANRYCADNVCSYRCRSGFTASGSSCLAETTSTSTSTAPEATQTCSLSSDCSNTVPASSNRYCDSGVCTFRCRFGYTQSGSICAFSGTGGSSGTSWAQSSSVTTLAEFKSDVINSGRFSWGDTQGNLALLAQGVPASEWTGGVKRDSEPALQVTYPAGSRNPSFSPVGGMGFYTSQIDVTQATNVSFSYSLFFEDGFNFVKGGKLPGLYGGKSACSGGSAAENCFSTRLMFRKDGAGELYLYAPREKQVDALCELGPLSYCNSVYGMSIGRGSWTFKTGEWTDVRQDVWLNTPGKADGGFNIWINGKLVLSSSEVYYRNSAVGQIGTGPSNSTLVPLIDYDALPDTVAIPNGGFKPDNGTGVFRPSFVTKVVGPTETATAQQYEDTNGDITATSLPFDWEARRLRRRNSVALATPTPTLAPVTPRRVVALDKRAGTVATTVPGFLGAMCQTFFGGSSIDYNSPTLQHSYFRSFALRING
ncbi:hypothetical protein JCM3775_005731 [Rhodotorula graminis]